jgi:transposase
MIDPNHPVRAVNQVIDSLDIDPLLKKYKGGGSSSYHPRLMLKILVYGYLTNQYSSRKIEQALTQNILFKWLSAMSYPDHNTINRFRSDRLKGVLKEVFSQVVLLLVDNGVITLKEAYLDGTKLEANANRYTFVWGRSIIKSKERIRKQIDELWAYAESVAREELENNEYLEKNKIEAFVKYQYFHKEQSKKWRTDPYRTENLPYDEKSDSYTCPMGQQMNFIKEKIKITINGFRQIKRLYKAQNCNGCPMRDACNKSKGERVIEINRRLNYYKSIIRERLTSERGIKYRCQRPADVEAVFGIIKGNRNYRKFLLRGLEKVEIEVGILSLAHNLGKLANKN